MAWMIPGLIGGAVGHVIQSFGLFDHVYEVLEVLYGHSHQVTWMIPDLNDGSRRQRVRVRVEPRRHADRHRVARLHCKPGSIHVIRCE
jgi:hypothetical protein